jgi:hypothetical protein
MPASHGIMAVNMQLSISVGLCPPSIHLVVWTEYKKMWRNRPLRKGGPGIVLVDATGLPRLCVVALATLLVVSLNC